MYCKYCGEKIDDNSLYCSYCGKSLQNNKEQENKITIQYNISGSPGIRPLEVASDISIINLKIYLASMINEDIALADSRLILDRTREDISNKIYLKDVDLNDDDVLIFVPYIRRPRYRDYGDMRCLYGCPMSKTSLNDAENYLEKDSVVEDN
jgi:uncharacterized membrane protein YvbJ